MPVDYKVMLAYLVGIIFIFVLGRMLLAPAKVVVKLIANTLLGGLVLFAINYIGGMFNFHMAFNIVTTLIVGFLGLPGIGLILMLDYLFNT